MKKISWLAIIVFIISICFSTMATTGDSIDLSHFSFEELIALRSEIDTEIEKHISNLANTLIPGRYVVGRDIQAGSYVLHGLMDKGPDGYTPQALVAESIEDAKYTQYTDYEYMKYSEKWYISVNDGNIIEIRSGDVSIQNARPLACGIEEINSNDPSLTSTSTLIPGRYIAGKNIKAGNYVLLGLMDKGPDGYTPQALTAESVDDAVNSEYTDYQYLKAKETWRISLQPGNVLEIRSGDMAVQEMEPLAVAPIKTEQEQLSLDPEDSRSESEEIDDGSPVIKGIYAVGRDLQAGSYNITMTNCKQATVIATFASKEDLSSYTSWDSSNNLKKHSKTAIFVNKGQTSHVYLEEGDYLYIGDGSGVIKEADNSTFVRGVYHVGKEIAPGSYFITLTNFHNTAVVATFANSSDLVSYTSWDSSSNLQQYSTTSVYVKKNEAFHITLLENEYLYISDGTGSYERK